MLIEPLVVAEAPVAVPREKQHLRVVRLPVGREVVARGAERDQPVCVHHLAALPDALAREHGHREVVGAAESVGHVDWRPLLREVRPDLIASFESLRCERHAWRARFVA